MSVRSVASIPHAGSATDPTGADFPVREYIASMAAELAQMARWDGDEPLGRLLDSAAALAEEPQARGPGGEPPSS